MSSVGLSPIKEENHFEQILKDIAIKLDVSEKENINLMNLIKD